MSATDIWLLLLAIVLIGIAGVWLVPTLRCRASAGSSVEQAVRDDGEAPRAASDRR